VETLGGFPEWMDTPFSTIARLNGAQEVIAFRERSLIMTDHPIPPSDQPVHLPEPKPIPPLVSKPKENMS
jgi:hypothetical protein